MPRLAPRTGGSLLRRSIEPMIGSILFANAVITSGDPVSPGNLIVWLIMLAAVMLLPFYPLASLYLGTSYFALWVFAGDSRPIMALSGALIVYNWFSHNRNGKIVLAVVYPIVALVIWVYRTSLEDVLSNAVFFAGLTGVAVAAGTGAYRHYLHEQQLVVEGEEALRRIRLLAANELHDSVAQSQSLVVMRLRELLQDPQLPQELALHVSDLLDVANGATKELRSAMAALRDVDQEFGSVGEIAEEESLSQHWVQLNSALKEAGFAPEGTFNLDGVTISSKRELQACRILGELVTNIVWHGEPGPCRIEVFESHGTVVMRSENSISILPMPRKNGGGQGIAGVKDRVEQLGGSCSFGSTDSVWRAEVKIPVSD